MSAFDLNAELAKLDDETIASYLRCLSIVVDLAKPGQDRCASITIDLGVQPIQRGAGTLENMGFE